MFYPNDYDYYVVIRGKYRVSGRGKEEKCRGVDNSRFMKRGVLKVVCEVKGMGGGR